MKTMVLKLLVIGLTSTILMSCNSNNTGSDNVVAVQPDSVIIKKQPVVTFYNPIENYFTRLRPDKKIEATFDSTQFTKDFQFAATMNNISQKINFSKENIGAIILPETIFETNITIQTARVQNDTLHIVYTVKQGSNEQTYSTIPFKLFAYNKKFKLIFDYQK